MPLSISGDSPNLTNATLTTPTLTSPTLTSATLTSPTIDSAPVPTVVGTAPIYGVRAWVCFNGTGTTGTNQTIKASGNVTSVLKNATGTYTITFTTAMSDANYALTGSASRDGGSGETPTVGINNPASTKTVSSVQIILKYPGSSGEDRTDISVLVLR